MRRRISKVMKKSLALAALASAVASTGLMFIPATMPYTPFVIGAFAAVGVGLLVTSR
jgi:Na+-translocating ferredoxin:NAD+ oxidoreductase RnfD subunit